MASLRASPSDTSKISEKKEVLYGVEKTIEIMVQYIDRAMVGYDVCGNRAAPSFILGSDPLRNALVGLKKRGLRLSILQRSPMATFLTAKS